MRPKVSVIMPVYNAEAYLEDSVASVLSQTLGEIEVICVDDGSTDTSLEKLQQLAHKDARVKILSQKNQGAGPARNHGIENASGEYIAFMDPDDWYPNNQVLERIYNAAKKHDALICGGSLVEFKDGELSSDYSRTKAFFKFDEEGFIRYDSYQYDYGYQRFLYSRSLLNECGIIFPPYRRYQDPPFFVRAMVAAEMFYALPEPSYVYRVEYKKLNWDAAKIAGVVNGMCDVIEIARDNELKTLLALELGRLRNGDLNLLFDNLQCAPDCLEAYKRLVGLCTELDGKLAKGAAALESNAQVKASFQEGVRSSSPTGDPCVSVIVPAYNAIRYLPDCLDSIRAQSLQNIEIIVVNDGSTDSSIEYLRKIAEEDERIVVIDKENGGLSSARNAGLAIARGDYVCFVDSDDMLRGDALELAYGTSVEGHLDQLFYSAMSFYESYDLVNSEPAYLDYYDYHYAGGEVMTGQELFVTLDVRSDYKPSACLQLLKKEFLSLNEISFKEGILHEDNLFTILCTACSKKSALLREKLYIRRVRKGSIMTSSKGVRNAYGYYCSVADAALFFDAHNVVLSKEFITCLAKRNAVSIDQAVRYSLADTGEEVEEFIEGLAAADELLFSAMVVDKASLETRVIEQEDRIKELQSDLSEKKREINRLRSSYSFRLGRMATKLPRVLKRGIKKVSNK